MSQNEFPGERCDEDVGVIEGDRGMSNVIATFILIAATVVAGAFVFSYARERMQSMGRTASVRVDSLDLVATDSGDIASATVKNPGSVALDNVKVKIVNQAGENVTLSIGHLPPGRTGSDHRGGDWGFRTDREYPVLVTARGPGGEKIISRAMSVRAN